VEAAPPAVVAAPAPQESAETTQLLNKVAQQLVKGHPAAAPTTYQVPNGASAASTQRVALRLVKDPVTGSLGLRLIEDEHAGVSRVWEIVPGSVSAKSGIAVGDVLLDINGEQAAGVGHKQVVNMIAQGPTIVNVLVERRTDPVHVVHIDKTAGTGLGMDLRQDPSGTFVHALTPGGQAARHDVRVGDMLFSINGQLAVLSDHTRIIDVLRQSTGVVDIGLMRKKGPGDSLAPVPRTVSVDVADGAPLGVVLATGYQSVGATVDSVSTGGRAEKTGEVRAGDVILAVGDQPCADWQHEDIVALIAEARAANGTVTLTLREPDATALASASLDVPRTVVLQRSPSLGFGLQLYTQDGTPGTRVKGVLAGGPAEAADVRQGDLLMSVQGQSTLDMPHEGIVQLLQGLQTVTLVLGAPDPSRTHAERTCTRKVQIVRVAGQPLGLQLRRDGSQGPTYVEEVTAGSSAAGLDIFPGDVLVAVNDTPVRAWSQVDIVRLIKDSPSVVTLLLAGQPSTDGEGTPPRRRVTLDCSSGGIGLRLRTVEGEPSEVIDVIPDGVASRSDVHLGDRILTINGADMCTATHQQVIDALLLQRLVTLELQAGPFVFDLAAGRHGSSISGLPGVRVVTLRREAAGKPLGLVVRTDHDVTLVHQVLPDSPAAASGLLEPEQQIVELNGLPVIGMSHSTVMKTFSDGNEVIVGVVDVLRDQRVVRLRRQGRPFGVSRPNSGGRPSLPGLVALRRATWHFLHRVAIHQTFSLPRALGASATTLVHLLLADSPSTPRTSFNHPVRCFVRRSALVPSRLSTGLHTALSTSAPAARQRQTLTYGRATRWLPLTDYPSLVSRTTRSPVSSPTRKRCVSM